MAPGTTIYTDCWRAYKTDELREAGFNHLTVNHRYHFVNPKTGAHTQNIERLWGLAKWRNKRQRGTARCQLDTYLTEFIWRRYNHGRDLFDAILHDIAI